MKHTILTSLLLAAVMAAPTFAQSPADDAAELAKKLQNPVASLISVPFQFNYDEGFGVNNAGSQTPECCGARHCLNR